MPIATIRRDSVFVDTSGWASIASRDEALHPEVSIEYQRAVHRGRTLVTTNYVLTEVVALLSSRPSVHRTQLLAFIDALKASPHLSIVHIDEPTDAEAWALLKSRADKSWSLVDASSFVVMRRYGLTEALATDHHFAQAGFVRLPII